VFRGSQEHIFIQYLREIPSGPSGYPGEPVFWGFIGILDSSLYQFLDVMRTSCSCTLKGRG
ncbi:Hypothetical protein FKW44_002988, partial [Caligus rogercresseyi]